MDSRVDIALQTAAAGLVRLPEYKRDCDTLRPLEERLNRMLPLGWKGYLSMNAISAHSCSDQDPDQTGQPVWVRVRRIWLEGEDLTTIKPVEETGYWKYPSWCCGWCGTDLRDQQLGPAGECPICGGN